MMHGEDSMTMLMHPHITSCLAVVCHLVMSLHLHTPPHHTPRPLHVPPHHVTRPLSLHMPHCHAPHASLLCWCDFLFFFFLLTLSFAVQSPHTLTILFAAQWHPPQPQHHMAWQLWPQHHTWCDNHDCDTIWHNDTHRDHATTVTVTPHSVTTLPATTTTPHGTMAMTTTPHVVWQPWPWHYTVQQPWLWHHTVRPHPPQPQHHMV